MRNRLKASPSLVAGLCVLAPFLLFAILPDLFARYVPTVTVGPPLQAPGRGFWLGTDEIGRDIWSRIVFATRSDLTLSVGAAVLSAIVGSAIGMLAGLWTGWFDAVAMRVTDVVLSFPPVLLALFLVATLGRSPWIQLIALALLFSPSFARLARGLTMSLKHKGFVEASQIAGAGTSHIVRRHLLVNSMSTILVGVALTASYSLLTLSTLSYLGLGPPPPAASWGGMIQSSFTYLFQSPWYSVFPGAAVLLVGLGFTWLGDGLEEWRGSPGSRRRGASWRFQRIPVGPAGSYRETF